MANCVDCFQNCADRHTTDRCVEYTGEDIPLLGICKGDTLFEVEVIIIEKLLTLTDGTGILLSDLTIDCDFLEDILDGEDQNLANIIQMLVTASCTLRELIQDIQDEIDEPFVVDAPCLTLPSDPTRDDILAATANKLCLVSTDVAAIKADYVKASELCTAVAACVADNPQENTKMPKYVALPYLGPLTVFDSTGAGLAAFGYDKVYICNVKNGTQDMRGRDSVGANINVVGPALDAAVDPATPANAGYSFAQNTKKGTYTDTLSVIQIPAHTHVVNDPGHVHPVDIGSFMRPCGSSCTPVIEPGTGISTDSAVTGITLGSTGGSQPHNTTQPSFGVVWIVYIP
jgi:hypothetical protein